MIMASANTIFEQVANSVAAMSRDEVKDQILHFEGNFKLDFPEDYLDKLPEERLRHILLAAKLHHCQPN